MSNTEENSFCDAEELAKKIFTLDELISFLCEKLVSKHGTVFSVDRGLGYYDHRLWANGRWVARWKSQLVAMPPLDGKTPRGESEYFDLQFS